MWRFCQGAKLQQRSCDVAYCATINRLENKDRGTEADCSLHDDEQQHIMGHIMAVGLSPFRLQLTLGLLSFFVPCPNPMSFFGD